VHYAGAPGAAGAAISGTRHPPVCSHCERVFPLSRAVSARRAPPSPQTLNARRTGHETHAGARRGSRAPAATRAAGPHGAPPAARARVVCASQRGSGRATGRRRAPKRGRRERRSAWEPRGRSTAPCPDAAAALAAPPRSATPPPPALSPVESPALARPGPCHSVVALFSFLSFSFLFFFFFYFCRELPRRPDEAVESL